MTEQNILIRTAGGKVSATVTAGASDSVRGVVMVHGGPGGNKDGPGGLFTKLAARLADRGIGSLRFDMLGEGQSGGNYRDVTLRRQADQLEAVLRFARTRVAYYERICVVAESLGATALLLQVRWPPAIQTAVLLWPAINPEATSLSRYLTTERLHEAGAEGYVTDGEHMISERLLVEVMAVGSLRTFLGGLEVPVLLLHGGADEEVPVSQSLDAVAVLPAGSRLVVASDGGHGLLDQQQLVLDQTVEWICEKL